MRMRSSLLLLGACLGACTLVDLPNAPLNVGPGSGSAGGTDSEAEPECQAAVDCGENGNLCVLRSCVDGTCENVAVQDLVEIASQAAGDCRNVVCDGEGGEKYVNDVDDVYDDGNECTKDECNDGVPVNQPNSGAVCNTGFCDATGACVACLSANDCELEQLCTEQGYCIEKTCIDDLKNNGETDVDCGGVNCAPCEDGAACASTDDCVSSVCTELVCQVPTCTDAVANALESDVDCGGSDCPPCGDHDACIVPSDCTSGVCSGDGGGNICQVPTCTDGVVNGAETDIDCGGGSCAGCAKGENCDKGSDCASLVCDKGSCKEPSCNDGVENGSEKGVDCGGSCPNACAESEGVMGNPAP